MLNESVSEKGFKALSNLQHFEEFIFCSMDLMYCKARINADDVYKKNLHLCIQHLPKLRIIGERIDCQDPSQPVILGQVTTEQLLRMNKPLTLGLQEATLSQVSSIPAGISLPNLKTLLLLKPSRNFHCDSRLSTVTELCLHGVSMATCLKILDQIGRQLKKLILYVTDTMFVDKILSLSPNLEHFAVVRSPTRLKVASCINPVTLQRLEVLELLMRRPSVEYVIDSEVMLQLLQAPNLRQLEMRLVTMQQREAEEIVRRLQRGEILQKLESAILQPFHEYHVDNPCKEERDRMDLVTSSMVMHCPKLVNVFNESDVMFQF
jgi:hypothetical protein